MPDQWRAHVRLRLRPLNVRAEREHEIIEELAQQLEAAYDAAVESGCDREEATRLARSEVPDWQALATTLESVESRSASDSPPSPSRSSMVYCSGR